MLVGIMSDTELQRESGWMNAYILEKAPAAENPFPCGVTTCQKKAVDVRCDNDNNRIAVGTGKHSSTATHSLTRALWTKRMTPKVNNKNALRFTLKNTNEIGRH